MRKPVWKFFIILLLLMGFNQFTHAQGPPGDPTDPDEIPLDPGSWILAAAGVGYGIKKWKDSKQKNNKNEIGETASFLQEDVNQHNL